MRCTLRTVRNDAHPRTFRTLVDLDYSTPRLDCRDAPPLECSVRSDELPVSMRMRMCDDDDPFIVLTETKFSFRCIPVGIGTLLTGLGSTKKTHVIMFSP